MTRQEVEAAFLLAGIRLYAAQPFVNPYPGSQTRRGPKWTCSTEFGDIVMGWRKRVIEIDWRAVGPLETKRSETAGTYTRWLTEDDTDQGPTYVHSYGLALVPGYLAELRVAIRHGRIAEPAS